MIQQAASYSLCVLFICIGLVLYRMAKGPTMADRVVAADALFLNLIAIAAVHSLFLQTSTYFDLVLVFSLLGFVGTVCFSKFLSRGKMIE